MSDVTDTDRENAIVKMSGYLMRDQGVAVPIGWGHAENIVRLIENEGWRPGGAPVAPTREKKPGIYRGGSDPVFGLWRLRADGVWLFSVPVAGETWQEAGDQSGEGLAPFVLGERREDPRDARIVELETRVRKLNERLSPNPGVGGRVGDTDYG